ncbi:MAG TPA: DUF2341 domain-containing protein [Methanoregulaceae archaeon]|nr:DUF2341 domain-containing protein [Methanoregulaceae archaeon]
MTQYANTAIAHYAGWPSRALYTVNNPPATGGYSVRLVLAWVAGMQNYFQDLRFRDPATLKRCAYQVESVSGAQGTAVVWVLLYAWQTQLEMLYGNATAASESNGADVHLEFADFSGPIDTARWTDLGGTAVADGHLTITSAIGSTRGIRSIATYGEGYHVRSKQTSTALGANQPARIGFEPADLSKYAVFKLGAAPLAATYDTALQYTAITVDAAEHVFDVRRKTGMGAYYEIDGTAVASHSDQVPSAALPATTSLASVAGATVVVDWIIVRKQPTVEPTLSLVSSGANPYSLAAPDIGTGTASIGFAFAFPDLVTTYTGPAGALWSEQLVESWSVSRGIGDALTRFSGVLDRHIDPAIRNFPKVDLVRADHNGIDRRLWFGFIPTKDSEHAIAANRTPFAGYSYDYFLTSRDMPAGLTVMPKASEPGAWLAAYYGDAGNFPDGTLGRAMFIVTKIRTVPGWGTTVPAVDIVGGTTVTAWQMGQKVADKIGWILHCKPIEIGATQSYTHQDPAYRIIRREAEDFDTGGEGVAYHDTTATNLGGAYRKTEGVDIEFFQAENGYNVGWIRDGEWLRYTVTIPAGIVGDWTAKFRIASAAATGARSFKVYWGTNPASLALIEDIAVDGTGAYSTFRWNTDEATLPVAAGGTHYLKLLFDNAGDDSADLLHMNLAAIDLFPPVVAGAATEVRPAIYFCDENDIDSPTVGLDLPTDPNTESGAVEIHRPDPTLVGLKFQDNFAEVATAVNVRFKWKNSATGAMDDTVYTETAWHANSLEGWVDRSEVLDEPIETAALGPVGTAGTARYIAQALAADLVAAYSAEWGTVTATFTKRTDLELFQTIRFVGYGGVPSVDPTDGTTPYLFRITNIRYSGALADISCTITAMPAARWSLLRRINRILNPDQVTETEATVKAVLAAQPPTLTGHVSAVATGGAFQTVTLDGGGTLTCRGAATLNDRVICHYTPGAGYVAVVFKAA